MRRLNEALRQVVEEISRSVDKHGDWQGYDEGQIYVAINDEFDEYLRAYDRADVNGPHGQRAELLQLATVAIKGYIRLGDTDNKPQTGPAKCQAVYRR